MKMKSGLVFLLMVLLALLFGCITIDRDPSAAPSVVGGTGTGTGTGTSTGGGTTPGGAPSPRTPAAPATPRVIDYDLSKGYLTYKEFGAVGDGKTNDFDAIIDTHNMANRHGLKVKADQGFTYYIAAEAKTARIQTDTDWTGAEFIIDDYNGPRGSSGWRDSWVFEVQSAEQRRTISSVTSLTKGQTKLNLELPFPALIVAQDVRVRHFIRSGPDQNSGFPQTDVFMIDRNGNVDPSAPIIWDFARVSSMIAYPIDENVLTLTGGTFTTMANSIPRLHNYMSRGIRIIRSNTVIDGLVHYVTNEGPQSEPYHGFIFVENSVNVTLQNSTLTGRRYYYMGTYDLQANRTINFSVINCDQTNDISDRTWWGIMASNYSKNILYDGVKFSRFDAHMGVYNTTIINSELGYHGVAVVGSGLLRIENTKVHGRTFLHLRGDYGAFWEGEAIIRNCTLVMVPSNFNYGNIILAVNKGNHNYGFDTFMPDPITIDGFYVDETNASPNYQGNFLIWGENDGSFERFPYRLTRTIYISGYRSAKPLIMPNDHFERQITVVRR